MHLLSQRSVCGGTRRSPSVGAPVIPHYGPRRMRTDLRQDRVFVRGSEDCDEYVAENPSLSLLGSTYNSKYEGDGRRLLCMLR